MTNKYKCKNCGFEWSSPEKEYEKCPDCQSEEINKLTDEGVIPGTALGKQSRGRMGGGPPRVCKCTQCGYEVPKTPGFPCRNDKCPECGAQLCGAD